VYDFLIELFSIALTVETLQAEICRRVRFLKGVGHFDRPLKVEGDVIIIIIIIINTFNVA